MFVVTDSLTGGPFVKQELSHIPQLTPVYYDNVVMAVDFLDIVGSEVDECVHAVHLRSVDLFVQL